MPRRLVCAVLALLTLAAPTPAQPRPDTLQPPPSAPGPAGNAHPEQRLVGDGQGLPNPFGDPAPAPALDGAAKATFARAVDLEPLRSLAVFHNGRVKVLDSLALETVETVAGKHRLDLPIDGEKAVFDPLFTLLDFMIDPAFYFERPVVTVGYLPLRDAYLERAFPDDPQTRLRWRKLTRVSPRAVRTLSTDIFNAHADEEPYRAGVNRAEDRLKLFLLSPTNLNLIAPESSDAPWHHLAEWPEESPARRAAAELGAAWRAADAQAASAAAARLAEVVPSINAGMYPTTRREVEIAYNKSNLFEWGYWAYFVSLLALVLAFGTGRRWLTVTGLVTLALAVTIHALGFAARCYLAERFAIQNQFESMTGLSLFAAIVGLAVMIARRQHIFGAAAAAAGFLVLITATETGIPGRSIEREAAILNTSVLLKYHVTTVLTSYGLITLGFVVSAFYLVTHYAAKLGAQPQLAAAGAVVSGGSGASLSEEESPKPRTIARTLADLDKAQMIMLQLAFWTLGVGILLGAWWADHSWGRWWAFDPKETWALITWIVYLIAIHARFAGVKDKGLTTAWLSLAGFAVMLFTYFGVNLMLPGLHAYA